MTSVDRENHLVWAAKQTEAAFRGRSLSTLNPHQRACIEALRKALLPYIPEEKPKEQP